MREMERVRLRGREGWRERKRGRRREGERVGEREGGRGRHTHIYTQSCFKFSVSYQIL